MDPHIKFCARKIKLKIKSYYTWTDSSNFRRTQFLQNLLLLFITLYFEVVTEIRSPYYSQVESFKTCDRSPKENKYIIIFFIIPKQRWLYIKIREPRVRLSHWNLTQNIIDLNWKWLPMCLVKIIIIINSK